jgi:hypothetical protein
MGTKGWWCCSAFLHHTQFQALLFFICVLFLIAQEPSSAQEASSATTFLELVIKGFSTVSTEHSLPFKLGRARSLMTHLVFSQHGLGHQYATTKVCSVPRLSVANHPTYLWLLA